MNLINLITELNWSPSQTILATVVFYLILGCFMETLSMMITTVPIITPIVVGMGYDPIWFGRISDVMLGVIPFFVAMIAMIAVIICIPDVVM